MPQLNAFDQAIEDLDRPKKTRKKSHTEELAKWFWVEILQKTHGMFTDPDWWRYMGEASRLLNPYPKGHNYDFEVVKRAIQNVITDKGAVTTMAVVEWRKGDYTYYELALNQDLTMPPIYDELQVQWYLEKQNARALSGSAS